MTADFHALLANLCNLPCPEMEAAVETVMAMRSSDVNSFFREIIPVISAPELAAPLRCMAFVVAFQVFPALPDFLSEPFAGMDPRLIADLLSHSFAAFGDPVPQVRSTAAALFSRIACTDVKSQETDQFDIMSTILQAFQNPPSLVALETVCKALSEILDVTRLPAAELTVVLQCVFNFLGADDFPFEIRNACLKVLKSVTDNMSEFLEEEENVRRLFQCLFTISESPETRAAAFSVWDELTVHYYPMLEPIVEQIVDAGFVGLTSPTNDRESLIALCQFWESVAGCEMDKAAMLHITGQVAATLLPMLFEVVAMVNSPECDDPDMYEPHIVAATAAQAVVACAPSESAEPLVGLIEAHGGSEEVGRRDGALHSLNFLIQFCNVTPIMDDALALIHERLTDGAPRIRETAVYCVHALLQSILKNGDNCPFAEAIPQIGQRLIEIGLLVIDCIEDEPGVSSTAASTIADFIQFPRFPVQYIGLAMGHLLGASVQDRDFRLSEAALSALQNATSNFVIPVLERLLLAVMDTLTTALANPTDDLRVQHGFFRLLQNILMRLPGCVDEHVERLWGLINQTFEQFPDEGCTILSPLVALARSAGDLFLPLLPESAAFVLRGLHAFEREDAVAQAAQGISLLCDRFEMVPFAGLATAIAHEEVPLQIKRFVAEAIGDLARAAPAAFTGAAEAVLPGIATIYGGVRDVLDAAEFEEGFDPDPTIIASGNCLRAAVEILVQAQAPIAEEAADALLELLEFVGGMKEHGDDLLGAALHLMAFMIQAFPEHMEEAFQDEPGFEIVLKEAWMGGVETELADEIRQFAGFEFPGIEEEEDDAEEEQGCDV
jgi:hypothetical protein